MLEEVHADVTDDSLVIGQHTCAWVLEDEHDPDVLARRVLMDCKDDDRGKDTPHATGKVGTVMRGIQRFVCMAKHCGEGFLMFSEA